MSELDYIVYLLFNNSNNCTYIGITNNPERRLQQHNKEIAGGAKYTTSKNCLWKYYGFIPGLEKNIALSLEKKIHIHSRKMNGKMPIEKRINYINKLLLNYKNLFFIKI